jgi:hypothetical protein
MFSRLETGHLLQAFRVSGPFYLDLRGSGIDAAQVVGRQFDCHCFDVLFEAI